MEQYFASSIKNRPVFNNNNNNYKTRYFLGRIKCFLGGKFGFFLHIRLEIAYFIENKEFLGRKYTYPKNACI